MKLSLQHIHVLAKDKNKLADWYCRNLDFTVVEDLEKRGEINGPILITSDANHTGVSIFTSTKSVKNILPAFGAPRDHFLKLHDRFQKPRIYDHYHFFSFYIHDSEANRIEICCLDYEALREELNQKQIEFVLMTPETYTPQ